MRSRLPTQGLPSFPAERETLMSPSVVPAAEATGLGNPKGPARMAADAADAPDLSRRRAALCLMCAAPAAECSAQPLSFGAQRSLGPAAVCKSAGRACAPAAAPAAVRLAAPPA